MIRVIWWAITVIAYHIVWLPLAVAGLFIIPVAIVFGGVETSCITGKQIFNAPKWLWLYGNDEDGYMAQWYVDAHPTWSDLRVAYTWAAIRNPVNNLRFIKSLHPPQRKGACQWRTWGNFTLIYQGLFSRIIWNNGTRWVGAGWKYDAEDKDSDGWKAYGVGFGVRLKQV